MKSDKYLSEIIPPPPQYANLLNHTNFDYFVGRIFDLMDPLEMGFLNLHAYLELRIMVYSWRKCAILSPFIEESSWECAITVVSNMKVMSRSTLRNTYYMCLDVSNSFRVRTIDFISFLYFATAARVYGTMNQKGDGDVTSKLI